MPHSVSFTHFKDKSHRPFPSFQSSEDFPEAKIESRFIFFWSVGAADRRPDQQHDLGSWDLGSQIRVGTSVIVIRFGLRVGLTAASSDFINAFKNWSNVGKRIKSQFLTRDFHNDKKKCPNNNRRGCIFYILRHSMTAEWLWLHQHIIINLYIINVNFCNCAVIRTRQKLSYDSRHSWSLKLKWLKLIIIIYLA